MICMIVVQLTPEMYATAYNHYNKKLKENYYWSVDHTKRFAIGDNLSFNHKCMFLTVLAIKFPLVGEVEI